jgi:hypothetical protein
MATLVYVLCALTAASCAVLLLRAHRSTRVKLLLWSGLCFVGLALNNSLLVVDVLVPAVDLAVIRKLPAVLGVGLLVFGLVWEAR